MLQTVRITSKRQITIPVLIFNQLGLSQGDELVVKIDQNRIIMEKAEQLLRDLAGSLKAPKKYQNKPIDFIIREAKKEYFAKRK